MGNLCCTLAKKDKPKEIKLEEYELSSRLQNNSFNNLNSIEQRELRLKGIEERNIKVFIFIIFQFKSKGIQNGGGKLYNKSNITKPENSYNNNFNLNVIYI